MIEVARTAFPLWLLFQINEACRLTVTPLDGLEPSVRSVGTWILGATIGWTLLTMVVFRLVEILGRWDEEHHVLVLACWGVLLTLLVTGMGFWEQWIDLLARGGTRFLTGNALWRIPDATLQTAIVIAIAEGLRMRRKRDGAQLAEAELEAELAVAHAEAERKRLRADRVLAALDEIESTLRTDPARARTLIARLGEQLRVTPDRAQRPRRPASLVRVPHPDSRSKCG